MIVNLYMTVSSHNYYSIYYNSISKANFKTVILNVYFLTYIMFIQYTSTIKKLKLIAIDLFDRVNNIYCLLNYIGGIRTIGSV